MKRKMKQLLVFTFFILRVSSAEDLKTIKADSGQTVTLPCHAPNNKILTGVEWSRPDLKTQYVLLYRDGRFYPDDQHPSYKGRAGLKDTQMEDQDVSLRLENVTIADVGTYECQALTLERNRKKRAVETISTVYLSVAPPGPSGGFRQDGGKEEGGEEGGSAGLIAGVAVFAMILIAAAAVGFVIYKKRARNQSQDSSRPSSVELLPLQRV